LLLEKGADVNAKSEKVVDVGRTVLHQVANNRHEVVAQLLLEKGADVNAIDWGRRTALNGAAKNGHEEVVQLLLEKGANVNVG
jgi:ankyrin repeat protein